MMKELLLHYARYNVWANEQIINTMLALEPGAVDKEIVSSFATLRKTVYHIWGAEDIWQQRLDGVPKPAWVAAIFDGSFEDACALWQLVSGARLIYTERMDDASLQSILSYNDVKGNPYQRRIWEVLQHVSNHSSYHRGQLVTMLRQVGVTEIPAMDFSLYMNLQSQ